MERHFPVMLQETLRFLSVRPDGTYADVTCGLGGVTGAIARSLTTGRVIALDRDPESLALARRRLEDFAGRVVFHHGCFSRLEEILATLGVEALDGLTADLGISFWQLTSDRGFGFQQDAPLDARMDRTEGETAADLLNRLSERELADLFYYYGEERRARKLARAIHRAKPIRTTGELVRVIESVSPRMYHRLAPATKVMMALRIACNCELEELDALLDLLPRVLRKGGRAVILSYHSLEDRRVKVAFRSLARDGRAALLNRHVVTPADEEIRENPPSRSARMRAIEVL